MLASWKIVLYAGLVHKVPARSRDDDAADPRSSPAARHPVSGATTVDEKGCETENLDIPRCGNHKTNNDIRSRNHPTQ
jgi:hypothetical protein